LNWKKIESHFETWSSDAQRINLKFVAYSFVANFVRYISAKYYLNWFSFHTVIMKVLGVNFFLKHSVYVRPWGWTIIFSQHYFPSLRDGKYNLQLFLGVIGNWCYGLRLPSGSVYQASVLLCVSIAKNCTRPAMCENHLTLTLTLTVI